MDERMPFAAMMGLEIDAIEPRGVRLRARYDERFLRPGGTIAGPIMMGLADAAMYALVLSRIGPVELAVTTELSINFLRKPAPGDVLAEARPLKLGKRLAVGEVRLWSDGGFPGRAGGARHLDLLDPAARRALAVRRPAVHRPAVHRDGPPAAARRRSSSTPSRSWRAPSSRPPHVAISSRVRRQPAQRASLSTMRQTPTQGDGAGPTGRPVGSESVTAARARGRGRGRGREARAERDGSASRLAATLLFRPLSRSP